MSATNPTEPLPHAYLDTSALVKRYVTERGSLTVRRLLLRHRVISSALLRLECSSALRRRKSENSISTRAANRIANRMRADEERWDLVAISEEILAKARDRILSSGVRTLDAIHIASAEIICAEGMHLPFVTADPRQAEGARAAGLTVIEVGL